MQREESGVPVATVIIPAKDAADTIGEQLQALAGQSFTGDWELIVADNGSRDETVQVARGFESEFSSLRVIDASGVAGSSHARNVGAQHAHAPLLVFCDADDIVDRDWLRAMVECAARWEILGGRLDIDSLNSDDVRAWRSAPEAARATTEVSFAPSGNMAIHADVFRALGGFNEMYPKSHDVEFSHRAVAAGHVIGFCPEAVVAYRLRSDLRGLARQAFRAGRASAQSCADGQRDPRRLAVTFRDWVWLVSRVPTVLVRLRRGIWVRRAAEAAGRLAGSVRWRVRYL